MGLHREDYEDRFSREFNVEEDFVDMAHKKKVKRMLEDRLERKRIKAECKDNLDEFDAEFDWDDLER